MKYLLLMVVLIAGWWFWRQRWIEQAGARAQKPSKPARSADEPMQMMVSCRVCGVHLPSSEVILLDANRPCCESCAQQSRS